MIEWTLSILASKAVFATLSLLALGATFVVAIGLVLEYERGEINRQQFGNLLVVIGVTLEAVFGFLAFSSALIRETHLEAELVALSPRPGLLYGKSRGNLIALLKPWAGQKVEIRACNQYFTQDEATTTAMLLGAILSKAGWRAAQPDKQIGPVGNGWIAPTMSDCGGTGLFVGEGPRAPRQTAVAAQGLIAALKGVPLEVNNSVQTLSISDIQPSDPSSIVLMVLAHPF